MKLRSIITLLLVLAISLTTAAARTPNAFARSRFADEDEPQLSATERREALELIARFDQRLRETNDFGQIVDELFVKDFSARSRQAPLHGLPWWLVDKSLLTTADPLDLRRYYVASLNFYQLLDRVMNALKREPEQAGETEADAEVEVDDALTPEIMNVLLSDPTIASLVKEFEKDEEDNGAKEDDGNQPAQSVDSTQAQSATTEADGDDDGDSAAEKSESGLIKSLAQLRDVSATLERVGELTRKRLSSLSLNEKGAPNHANAKDKSRVQNLKLSTVDANFYGYPKGTRVIHADLLPFCLTMIRSDGQLRILSVTVYTD